MTILETILCIGAIWSMINWLLIQPIWFIMDRKNKKIEIEDNKKIAYSLYLISLNTRKSKHK